MASATDKTVTVTMDPTATSKQSDVIPGATSNRAGVMTAAQVQALGLSVATEAVDIYVDATLGNDNNPGTQAQPFQTFMKALEALPAAWKKTAHINLAPGAYTVSGAQRVGSPVGPGAAPLIIIGTPTTLKTLTEGPGGSQFLITDLAAGMVTDEYIGAEVLCTSGANAGQAIGVRRNTATTVTLNGLFLAPIDPTDTFEIRRPGSAITTSGATSFVRSSFALAHVKFVGSFDIASCQIAAARNAEFEIAGNLNIPGSVGVLCGMNIGGAFSNDPSAPFSFFSFQSGAYVHGVGVMLISASVLRVSWLVIQGIDLVAEGCASPRIHGLAVLNGSVQVYTNTYLEAPPNGIFGFYPSALDASPFYVASANADLIFSDVSNSPIDAVTSDDATVWAIGVTGTGNAGFGLAAVEMGKIFAVAGTNVVGGAGETLVGATPTLYAGLPFSEVDASGPTLNRIQN